MTDQEKIMSWLEGLSQDDWRQFHSDSEVSNIAKAALDLLKEQQKTINALESDLKETLQVLGEKGGIVNELYDLLNETCKDFREATGGDNVCGLCHYEGCAYKGEEDWCGWCPGFDSNECFVMKNEIRKMAGKELLPDVDPQ